MERLIKTRRNNNGSPAADFSEMTREQYIRDATHPIENAIKRAETAAELREHIDDAAEYHAEHGFNNEEAMQKALAEMGEAKDLAKQFEKLYPGTLDWFVAFAVAAYCIAFWVLRFFMPQSIAGSDISLNSFLYEALSVGGGAVIAALCAAVGVRAPMAAALVSTLLINITNIFYSITSRPCALFLYALYSVFAGESDEIPVLAETMGSIITLKGFHAVSGAFFLLYFSAGAAVIVTHNEMRSSFCRTRTVKINKLLRRSMFVIGVVILSVDLTVICGITREKASQTGTNAVYEGYYIFEGDGVSDIETLFSPQIGPYEKPKSASGTEAWLNEIWQSMQQPRHSVVFVLPSGMFRVRAFSGGDSPFLRECSYDETGDLIAYNSAVSLRTCYGRIWGDPGADHLALIPFGADYKPLFGAAQWYSAPKDGGRIILPRSANEKENLFIEIRFDPEIWQKILDDETQIAENDEPLTIG